MSHERYPLTVFGKEGMKKKRSTLSIRFVEVHSQPLFQRNNWDQQKHKRVEENISLPSSTKKLILGLSTGKVLTKTDYFD